jgi:hypothetical protein
MPSAAARAVRKLEIDVELDSLHPETVDLYERLTVTAVEGVGVAGAYGPTRTTPGGHGIWRIQEFSEMRVSSGSWDAEG